MIRSALVLAAVSALTAAPAFAADGAQLFSAQCSGCHQAKSTATAPTLVGVYGAKIAGRSDYSYSPALKAKQGTWTEANLDAFLKSPQAFAPGTRMPISVVSPETRAGLIGYLKTLK